MNVTEQIRVAIRHLHERNKVAKRIKLGKNKLDTLREEAKSMCIYGSAEGFTPSVYGIPLELDGDDPDALKVE